MGRALPILAVLALAATCGSGPDGPVELGGTTMGTRWRVTLSSPEAGLDVAAREAEVARILQSVDEAMSTWDPESEVSRFNASRTTDWFDVSAQTATVVAEALRVGRLCHGAFDVTVEPLVELWGFGPGSAPGAVPDGREVAAALERVGLDLLDVRHAPPGLRKRRPDVRVDLSGLAKGFAVDMVADHLDAEGIGHVLVEVGGELRARGHSPTGGPWRVGIESPSVAGGPVGCVVPLVDQAIATSGDYRRFFETDGRRHAHVLDPRTGRPAEHGIASATVLAETAMEADAFATALLVLDPEEGLDLVERQGLSARLLRRVDRDLVELRTPHFPCVVVE